MFLVLVAPMHEAVHASTRLVGQRIRLESGFDGGWKGQLINAVDGRVVHDLSTAHLLQAQHWKRSSAN